MTPFFKYSGAGNDFILFEEVVPAAPMIRALCHRQLGVGADGVLVVSGHHMRIFNLDGEEASMCGNGLRCAARHLLSDEERCTIDVSRVGYPCERRGDLISVTMPPPHSIEWGPNIDLLNTGVPHAVLFVDKLNEVEIDLRGRELRHRFDANVNFATIDASGDLDVRTYERGVEGETLACGTGAVATALAAAHRTERKAGKIRVRVASGEELKVDLDPLRVEGPARLVYRGDVDLNSLIDYP